MFRQICDRAFILRYSQSHRDILVISARQTIRLFFIAIFSVITFGKRSPFLEFMSTSLWAERIWLCAFACVKRKYKTERAGRVWKFYSRRLYCTTSGTILFLYLRKRALPVPRHFSRGKLHYGVIARDESPPALLKAPTSPTRRPGSKRHRK